MPPSSSSDTIDDEAALLLAGLSDGWTPRQIQLMTRIIRRVQKNQRVWWVLTARGWQVL